MKIAALILIPLGILIGAVAVFMAQQAFNTAVVIGGNASPAQIATDSQLAFRFTWMGVALATVGFVLMIVALVQEAKPAGRGFEVMMNKRPGE